MKGLKVTFKKEAPGLFVASYELRAPNDAESKSAIRIPITFYTNDESSPKVVVFLVGAIIKSCCSG